MNAGYLKFCMVQVMSDTIWNMENLMEKISDLYVPFKALTIYRAEKDDSNGYSSILEFQRFLRLWRKLQIKQQPFGGAADIMND